MSLILECIATDPIKSRQSRDLFESNLSTSSVDKLLSESFSTLLRSRVCIIYILVSDKIDFSAETELSALLFGSAETENYLNLQKMRACNLFFFQKLSYILGNYSFLYLLTQKRIEVVLLVVNSLCKL